MANRGFKEDQNGDFIIEKDKDSTLNYTVDWTKWLAAERINLSIWTVPVGLTEVSSSISSDNLKATVIISGGVEGTKYIVSNRITTLTGLIVDQSFTITIQEQ